MAYYRKQIDEITKLHIDEQFHVVLDMDELHSQVQLEGKEEADKLIKEFEDPDGELCYAEGSIMDKYEQFHPFRP